MEIKDLFAEFPREDIKWRSQSLTQKGDKALALAYIDARHVMDRLDDVVGTENWQDRYEVHGSKTVCYLSIRVGDEWITKADGAGDTQVEAEKGSISDAFKRAAVKWGIGRYLYEIPAPWVPCETYTRNGKPCFSKFTEDPWKFVRGHSIPKPKAASRDEYTSLVNELRKQKDLPHLEAFTKSEDAKRIYASLPDDWKQSFGKEVTELKEELQKREAA